MRAITKENTAVKTGTKDITTEVSKVGFFIMLTVAMGFGILSISALIAGAIKVGGIGTLIGMAFGVI